MTRAAVLVLLALVACGNDRQVRELASPHLGCPASNITVVKRTQGDTSESYEVEGCGKRMTLVCNAPDFVCFPAR